MDNQIDKSKDTRENERVYYTGIFADDKGKPEFNGLGNMLRAIFLIYSLYILATHKYKYSTIMIVCLMLGNLMCGIRFFNISKNLNVGDDSKPFMHAFFTYFVTVILCIVSLLIIYLQK